MDCQEISRNFVNYYTSRGFRSIPPFTKWGEEKLNKMALKHSPPLTNDKYSRGQDYGSV